MQIMKSMYENNNFSNEGSLTHKHCPHCGLHEKKAEAKYYHLEIGIMAYIHCLICGFHFAKKVNNENLKTLFFTMENKTERIIITEQLKLMLK